MVYTALQTLPQELKMEVLQRLPLNSLMTLMRVSSKEWAPLIRSKALRDEFLSRSMTRPPRVLFVVQHSVSERRFLSVDPLCPSGQQEVRTQKSPVAMMVSQPIRGLLCIQGEVDIVICNPGAKEVRILQQPPEADIMSCFFGYDQSKDVFKVLAIGILSKQAQIFTVGSDDDKSRREIACTHDDDDQSWTWREIACTYAHVAITEGLFIEGVSYYGAKDLNDRNKQTPMIMSFNMTSEVFNAIQWPDQDVNPYLSTLVNYFGKLAIVAIAFDCEIYALNADGIFELWVWEGTWSKTRIEIQGWKKATGPQLFSFLGTVGETTLVFESSPLPGKQSHSLIYYDTVTGTLRRFEVDIDIYKKKHHTFLNHVDSTWLM